MSFDFKLENGSITIKNGKLVLVENTNKLIQDILKICLTDVGSNSLQPWYGSYLSRSVVGNVLDIKMTETIATTQLKNAIENLMLLQQEQLNYSRQNVTASEHIAAILDVSIRRNSQDPRLYIVLVSVLTKAFEIKTTSFNLVT